MATFSTEFKNAMCTAITGKAFTNAIGTNDFYYAYIGNANAACMIQALHIQTNISGSGYDYGAPSSSAPLLRSKFSVSLAGRYTTPLSGQVRLVAPPYVTTRTSYSHTYSSYSGFIPSTIPNESTFWQSYTNITSVYLSKAGYTTNGVYYIYSPPIISLSWGLPGSGAEVILDDTSPSLSCNVLDVTMYLPQTLGSISMNTWLRDALMTCMTTDINSAPALGVSGTITFYNGVMPASADYPTTSNAAISIISCSTTPNWNPVSNGIQTLISDMTGTANATGGVQTITFFRWTKGTAPQYVLQGTVGGLGSGADCLLVNPVLAQGEAAIMRSLTIQA